MEIKQPLPVTLPGKIFDDLRRPKELAHLLLLRSAFRCEFPMLLLAMSFILFGHLISNSLWFLPLSWLVLLKGGRDYLAVWIGVWLFSIPVWLFWPGGSHGLSGVIYGLLGYLLWIGWLEKRPLSLLLSIGCLLMYGGLLPALVPFLSPVGVSWIGHASGFAGGLLAAWAVQRP